MSDRADPILRRQYKDLARALAVNSATAGEWIDALLLAHANGRASMAEEVEKARAEERDLALAAVEDNACHRSSCCWGLVFRAIRARGEGRT